MELVYFSSVTENTHRFVQKLNAPAQRLPLRAAEQTVLAVEPFVLVTPTYGGGTRRGADVPKPVIRFLNIPENRDLLRGIIAGGNINFGADFCRAGDVISDKTGKPVLYRFELAGTTEDVRIVNSIMESILCPS